MRRYTVLLVCLALLLCYLIECGLVLLWISAKGTRTQRTRNSELWDESPIVDESWMEKLQRRRLSTKECSCEKWDQCTEPIDLVITWVNGSDPTHRQLRNIYSAFSYSPEKTNQLHRFRDNGELRYALRSVSLNAPWIRYIYLVTANQTPSWLDTSHPQIRVISHWDIFPNPHHLPTFNSLAIELHLHRIPGLSRHYLYMNDDFLIGSPICPEDFLTYSAPNACLLPLLSNTTTTLPAYTVFTEKDHAVDKRAIKRVEHMNSHWRAAINAALLLDAKTGPAPNGRRRMLAHVPILINRDIAEELYRLFAEELELTSAARFRDPELVFFHFLYAHYLHELSWLHVLNGTVPWEGVKATDKMRLAKELIDCAKTADMRQMLARYRCDQRYPDHYFLTLSDRALAASFIRATERMVKEKYTFICVNDDASKDPKKLAALQRMYEQMFPDSADFELVVR